MRYFFQILTTIPFICCVSATPALADYLIEYEQILIERSAESKEITVIQTKSSEDASRLLQQGIEQYQTSQFREALTSWQSALEIYRDIGDYANEGVVLNNIGNIYLRQGNYAIALEYFQQSLAISRNIGDQPGEASTLNNIGIIYDLQGSYSDALNYYQQSLAIKRDIGDQPGEASTLNNIGIIYQFQGDYAEALEYYQQSLAIHRDSDNWRDEASTLNNIGIIYDLRGNYSKALEYYQQSLTVQRQIDDRIGEAQTLNNIGGNYELRSNYAEALRYYQQSLAIKRDIGDQPGEASALNNIGNVYQLQGEYAEALDYYQQSLIRTREIVNKAVEAITLNNIGIVYGLQGSYSEAIDYYQQSLLAAVEIGDQLGEAQTLNNIGNIYRLQGSYPEALDYYQQSLVTKREIGDRVGEASSLNNIGIIYDLQGDYPEALDYYQRSLVITREIGDREGEAQTLNNIGIIYKLKGNYTEALNYYQQSLINMRDIGGRAGEAKVLGNIGYLFEAQEYSSLAIAFFKQAVNTYESIRDGNQALSQELKESYITTIEKDYRKLADLLLQQNRILEAQQVLDLLKVQELDDYLRGVRGTDTTLSILRAERAILAKYDELTTTAIELAQELANLRDIEADFRSEPQKQRILTLIDLQSDINKQFREFSTSTEVRDLLAQLTPELQDATVRLSSLNKIETELTDLNAALIYPLILDDRLEIVVMLPGGPPLRRTVNGLTSTELNTAILALRQAIDSPSNNPLPAAQQLYDWLIRPIETDLAQAGVTSLIYAPDGQLRYTPLSALHDGNSWLIEHYHINNITAESLTEFDDIPAPNPRVLAAAFADTTTSHAIEIDGQPRNFFGLPFAGAELDNLTATQPNITTFRDSDFTLYAIKSVMNEHQILHFATHAAFVNSNPEDSFILFGNGDAPTLVDIKDWRLSNVDLVVLSACETGLDGFGNGAEILGMGYQFQLSGAGAVMASLWSVDDRGTQDLMARFYHHLGEGNPKAQALQQAQLDLITSDGTTPNTTPNTTPRGSIVLDDPETALSEDLDGLRHPYYWAPFILIGNGL